MLAWMSGARKNENDDVCNRTSSLCGYLWKMKRSHQKKMLVTQWNKRWFSIEGRLLKWYALATSEKSSGMLDLRFITNVSEFESQGVYSFILSYPDRVLLLRASTLSDMSKWIRALQFQADIVRGGCGMTIVTHCNAAGSSPQGKGRAIKEKYRPPTLEANLEAAMVRLEILEDSVRKQSSDFVRKQPEKSSRNIEPDKRDIVDRGRGEESKSDLKTDDVRLLDSTRLKNEYQKSPKKPLRIDRACLKERGTHVPPHNYENGNDSDIDEDEHYFANRNKDRGKSGGSEEKEDYNNNNERGGGGRLSKGSRSSSSSRIKCQQDDNQCPNLDRVDSARLKRVPPASNYSDAKDVREIEKNILRTSSAGDESIEEIPHTVCNNARLRSQVSRNRDMDDRDSAGDLGNGRVLGSMFGADSHSTHESERSGDNEGERGGITVTDENGIMDGKEGQMNPNWGYEGEVYNCLREESFEGAISRKQSQALNIAAGRAAKYRQDKDRQSCNSSNANSNRTVDLYDNANSDYEDLPEMDLSAPLRRSSQRRERKSDREKDKDKEKDKIKPLSPSSRTGSQNSLGWV